VFGQPMWSKLVEGTSSEADPDPHNAFAANIAADGTAVGAGQVPSPATLRFLSGALAGANPEAVSVATGAPTTFGASLQTGLRALALLSDGALDFSAGRWRLRGTAPSAEIESAAAALLGAD